MDNHSTASLEGKIADGEEEEEEDDAFPDLFSSGKEKRTWQGRKPRSMVHLCLNSVMVLALPPLESSGFRDFPWV